MKSIKRRSDTESAEPPDPESVSAGSDAGSTAEAASLRPSIGEVMQLDEERMAKITPSAEYDQLLEHISRSLQEAYSELLTQPVPDRFIELLKQLEVQDKSKDATQKDGP